MKKARFLYIVWILLCIHSVKSWAYQSNEAQRNYNTIYVDQYNQIWFGAETGLYRWLNGKSEKIDIGVNLNISAIISFYQNSVQQLGLNPPNVDAVLVKDIPAVGKFYRLVFSRSIKYCITIFVNLRG